MLLWISLREKEVEEPISSKVKLFRQPQVQIFVAWIQEEEESSDEEGDEKEDDDEED